MNKIYLTGFLVCVLSLPVKAEPMVVDGGEAKLYGINTESPEDVVDIYSRQIEYMEKRLSFVRDMNERRESFARPSREARAAYQNNQSEIIAIRENEYDMSLQTYEGF